MQRRSAALGVLLAWVLTFTLMSTLMATWAQDTMRHVDLLSPDMTIAELTRDQVVAAVAAASAADRPRSPERVRPLRSAGVLQAGRDPIDRSQDRLEVATPTGIVDRKATQLAQQPHLEVAHRIDVRIAQPQAGE